MCCRCRRTETAARPFRSRAEVSSELSLTALSLTHTQRQGNGTPTLTDKSQNKRPHFLHHTHIPLTGRSTPANESEPE